MKKLLVFFSLIMLLILSGCDNEVAPLQSVNATLEKNSIVVEWEEQEAATSYRVFRKTDQMQDYKFVCDVNEHRYVDADIYAKSSFQYKVAVIMEDSISEGIESNVVGVPIQEVEPQIYLEIPTITAVTRMDKYTSVIQISSSNQDCEYEVFRANSIDGVYESVGTSLEPVYYDTTAEGYDGYFYKVCAFKEDNVSELSESVKIGTNAKSVFDVPILMYHEFVTQKDLDEGVAFDEYAIWYDEFESDLIWLRDHGYTTITTKELVDYLNGSGTMPEKPVILTIDDGKLGVYKNAWPLLQKYDMTASLAVIGYRIDAATNNPESRTTDEAPYCTWEEIGEMSDSGAIEIISHTYGLHVYSHDDRVGANCADGESLSAFLPSAQRDYATIKNKIYEATGTVPVCMAYPYSKRSEMSDVAWVTCGYQLLLSGDDSEVRPTYSNYFVRDAGVNYQSAATRRLVRMTGTPIRFYLQMAQE